MFLGHKRDVDLAEDPFKLRCYLASIYVLTQIGFGSSTYMIELKPCITISFLST